MDHKKFGNEAFLKRDFKNALSQYFQALKKTNDKNEKITIFSNLAAVYLEMGENEKCIEKCDLALELDPNNEKCLYRKARANLYLENYEKSLKIA